MRFRSAFILPLAMTSCATIVAGGPDVIPISSTPPGAVIKVDGNVAGTTPTFVTFNRGGAGHIQLELDGYQTAFYDVDKVLNGWFVGNLVFGGIIGIVIDLAANNAGKYPEQPISIQMMPLGGSGQAATPSANPANPQNAKQLVTSMGTGFLIGPDLVLTARHVVGDSSQITARISDIGDVTARVVAADRKTDICLLRLDRQSTVQPLAFCQPGSIKAGERVFVLGYPLQNELGRTQAVIGEGTVSRLEGLKGDLSEMMISVPVNPGNSGGPVLDASGHVAGILLSHLSDYYSLAANDAVPQGVNFAIHADVVRSLLRSTQVELPALEESGTPLNAEEIHAKYAAAVIPVMAVSSMPEK